MKIAHIQVVAWIKVWKINADTNKNKLPKKGRERKWMTGVQSGLNHGKHAIIFNRQLVQTMIFLLSAVAFFHMKS